MTDRSDACLLLVSDSPAVRAAVERLLAARPGCVPERVSGEEAFRRLEGLEAGVVLWDCTDGHSPPGPECDDAAAFTTVLTLLLDGTWCLIQRQQAAERAVWEEKERFRALVETIPHGIGEVTPDGTVTFANAVLHRMFGRPEGSAIGKSVAELVQPAEEGIRALADMARSFAEQPKPTAYFFRNTTPAGETLDMRVDWNYKRDEAGRATGFVAVVTDITQQRRAEEEARQRLNELAHVARLSTLGEMVSGLAHELNQPLTAISNYAQFCRRHLQQLAGEEHGEACDAVRQIAEQAARAGQIIRRLREFVRRPQTSRTPVRVADLIGDVVALMAVETRRHGVQIELDIEPDLPEPIVDRIQIEQVILNLVKNALEATLAVAGASRTVRIGAAAAPDGRISIAVIDSGKGFSGEEAARLFEPFYTTKPDGMGLGLSIGRSIVEAHGGRIEASQNPQGGATFRFTLFAPQPRSTG